MMRFDILSKRSICYTIFWCALVVLTGIHIDVRKKNPLVVAIISLLHLIVPWKPWKPLRELLQAQNVVKIVRGLYNICITIKSPPLPLLLPHPPAKKQERKKETILVISCFIVLKSISVVEIFGNEPKRIWHLEISSIGIACNTVHRNF